MGKDIKLLRLYSIILVISAVSLSLIYLAPIKKRAAIVIPASQRSEFLLFVNKDSGEAKLSEHLEIKEHHNGNLQVVISALSEKDLQIKIDYYLQSFALNSYNNKLQEWMSVKKILEEKRSFFSN